MDSVEEHPHSFAASEWLFSEPTSLAAFTTTKVLREGYPILLISHDHEGHWQFFCGTTNESAHGAIVCLGCEYQRDKIAGKLSDLPIGWQVYLNSTAATWERLLLQPDTDEASNQTEPAARVGLIPARDSCSELSPTMLQTNTALQIRLQKTR